MTTATEVMKNFFTVLKEYADDNSYYTDDPEAAYFSNNPTYGDLKKAELTVLKGLNTYWLKESAQV